MDDPMTDWQCVLQLDQQRNVVAGSSAALIDAIQRGADLRVGTEFRLGPAGEFLPAAWPGGGHKRWGCVSSASF